MTVIADFGVAVAVALAEAARRIHGGAMAAAALRAVTVAGVMVVERQIPGKILNRSTTGYLTRKIGRAIAKPIRTIITNIP